MADGLLIHNPNLAEVDVLADEQMYATPDELFTLYGVTVTEAQVRMAQNLINVHCSRPTLWPHEYEAELSIPSDRNEVVLHYRPVIKLLDAAGRYGYGRRDRRQMNVINVDYLAVMAVTGNPPQFNAIDVAQIDVDPATGICWLPAGLFLVSYSQVRLKWLAGFVDMPARVKMAMMLLINSICAKGEGDRTQYSVGKVSRTFATASYFTQDIERALAPFVVEVWA
jgi:hypothetical protein